MITFLLCDVVCLLAHLAMAFVAVRERIYFPLAYAGFCAAMCACSLVGAASDSFRAVFMTLFLPVFIAGWALYGLVTITRLRVGASPEETMLSAALLCGVVASFAVGFLHEPGKARTIIQTAVVVLPIMAAILAIGPRPFPEPVFEPAYGTPLILAPRPAEVTL